MVKCIYKEKCCFVDKKGQCRILSDVQFKDGKCHFRKREENGQNMYGLWESGITNIDIIQSLDKDRLAEVLSTIIPNVAESSFGDRETNIREWLSKNAYDDDGIGESMYKENMEGEE